MPIKIAIIGVSGSGKTTFGKKLSLLLGCPLTDKDELFWLPGWKRQESEHIKKTMHEIKLQDSWIISGNYSRMKEEFWPKSSIIIWLDLPLRILLWRALKRSLRRIRTKEPCCNGNRETWSQLFSFDSIVIWIVKTYIKRKRVYGDFFKDPKNGHLSLIRLRKVKEIDSFYNDFSV